jgi:hypothetical protein
MMGERELPLLQRGLIAFFGATIGIVPLIANLLSTYDVAKPILTGTQAIQTGFLIVLIIAWLLSIFLTTLNEKSNRTECCLESIGLPGLIASISVGVQAIN